MFISATKMQSAHVTVYTCKPPEEKVQGIYLSVDSKDLQSFLFSEKQPKENEDGSAFSFQQMKLERISSAQYLELKKKFEEKAKRAHQESPTEKKPNETAFEEKHSQGTEKLKEMPLEGSPKPLENKLSSPINEKQAQLPQVQLPHLPVSEEKNLLEPTNLNKSPVEQHQHQSALVEEKQATEGDDERFQENQSKYFESKENNFQSPEDQEIFAQMKQLAQEKNGVNEGTKLEEAQVKANEYYLYLKLKREREEEKRIAAEKRKEEDLRLIKENPKIIHISEDKAKLIPEKKAKLSHDSVNKNVSKLNKKNRIKRELEKKEEHREENLKKQQEEEAAKQAKLLELKLQEQREKLEAKAELERREALRVANLTPEQREQERLKKERDDRLLRAFAEGKKKEPLRVQRANKEALLKPTSPSIMSSGADDSIHSVDTSKPNLPFPNSKPCLPVSSSKASSILTNTNASAKGPVSTPTPIVSAVNSSSVISSPKSKTRNVWQEFSSSISSSSPSTVTNSPKSQNSPISSSSGVDSTATNNSPKSQNPPISNSSCRDSTTHNSPKSQNSPIFNSPVVDSTTNNSSTTQISPISNPPVVDSDAPRASLVEIAQPALATTASAQSTTASDPVRSTDPQSAGIPSAPPGLTVQTEARPIYPTVSVNSPSWFSPLVASPAIAPSAQAPISTTKPLALPLPTANPPTAVKPLSYSSLVTLGISTSISQNASPVKSNQQPSRIPTAPKKNPSPPRSAGSGSRQDSGNISKSNQQQATRTTNNSSTRVKTTRLLPPSLAPVEYCKCPPNNHVRMIVFPESFFCPISGEMMVDPVIDLDGITYVCASFLFKRSNQILHQFSVLTYSTHKERVAITTWLSKNQTSPLTRKPLFETDLRPNRALKECIDQFRGQTISKTVPQFCCDCGLTLPGL